MEKFLKKPKKIVKEYNPDGDWEEFIECEKQKEYFQNLEQKIEKSKFAKRVRKKVHGFLPEILPPIEQRYRAFTLCPLTNLKVVIIGQDPYHEYNQANGLAFSIANGEKIPPSLRNIFKELADDTGTTRTNTDLSDWAEQGVLLLNAVLSVREGSANSHKEYGWEIFTNRVIQKISDEKNNIVFILWGRYAQNVAKNVDRTKHHIIESTHPSPLSANRGGFFGSKPFSRCNEYLERNNKGNITW